MELLKKYPGRVFEFMGYLKDKKDLPRDMHVISRNHPLKADQIKKKFQLVEKGQEYLLATTLQKDKKVMMLTRRIY
ncbi:MAG: hypothetical protein HKN16_02315 [Saprospiraceae bacterium]|nr:hypothetical protein [Saprospiraceae bacterium]